MKTMDQLTPAELQAWVNGTYRAQTQAIVADLHATPVEQLASDFRIGFGLASQLHAAVGSLRGGGLNA